LSLLCFTHIQYFIIKKYITNIEIKIHKAQIMITVKHVIKITIMLDNVSL